MLGVVVFVVFVLGRPLSDSVSSLVLDRVLVMLNALPNRLTALLFGSKRKMVMCRKVRYLYLTVHLVNFFAAR